MAQTLPFLLGHEDIASHIHDGPLVITIPGVAVAVLLGVFACFAAVRRRA